MTATATRPAFAHQSDRGRRLYDAMEMPLGFAAGDANLTRYVGNAPTTLTDPSGLAAKHNVVDSGVKIAVTFQVGATLVGNQACGFPTHGFLVANGKGYGFFEEKLKPFGTGEIREDDLDTYPLYRPDLPVGSFYRLEAGITIDKNEHDQQKFVDALMVFIKDRENTPGYYSSVNRNCFTFMGDAVMFALENSRLNEGRTDTERFYRTKKWGDLDVFKPSN